MICISFIEANTFSKFDTFEIELERIMSFRAISDVFENSNEYCIVCDRQISKYVKYYMLNIADKNLAINSKFNIRDPPYNGRIYEKMSDMNNNVRNFFNSFLSDELEGSSDLFKERFNILTKLHKFANFYKNEVFEVECLIVMTEKFLRDINMERFASLFDRDLPHRKIKKDIELLVETIKENLSKEYSYLFSKYSFGDFYTGIFDFNKHFLSFKESDLDSKESDLDSKESDLDSKEFHELKEKIICYKEKLENMKEDYKQSLKDCQKADKDSNDMKVVVDNFQDERYYITAIYNLSQI